MRQDELIVYGIYAAVGFVVWFFATRWVHKIEGRNDRLNAAVLLLAEIALKQGVAPDKIEGIFNSNGLQNPPKQDNTSNPHGQINPAAAYDKYALPVIPELKKDNR